ncbi:DUF3108 domain-containing protein [Sphingomonas soli]|uniref:DUF3108 domain-containing protein n=1 Tax=Sphingomonas soli TaxID=266127 RepID=UPI00082CDD03|nr:hypothetical protein [Sphingomonas soli]
MFVLVTDSAWPRSDPGKRYPVTLSLGGIAASGEGGTTFGGDGFRAILSRPEGFFEPLAAARHVVAQGHGNMMQVTFNADAAAVDMLRRCARALHAAEPEVDGTRLAAGTQCYAYLRGTRQLGVIRQTVRPIVAEGKPAWDVIVHNWQREGATNIRDHFVLRARDLTPISFDRREAGVEQVRIAYGAGNLTVTRPGVAPVQTRFSGRIWDGHLDGLLLAGLPLSQGEFFSMPRYHHNDGPGRFELTVIGSERVAGQDAWVVETGEEGAEVRYFIGKTGRADLGYTGWGFTKRPGGDCSVIPQ